MHGVLKGEVNEEIMGPQVCVGGVMSVLKKYVFYLVALKLLVGKHVLGVPMGYLFMIKHQNDLFFN